MPSASVGDKPGDPANCVAVEQGNTLNNLGASECAQCAWNDRKIAGVCGVSITFVSSLRRPEVVEQRENNRRKSECRPTQEYPTQVKGCSPATPDVESVTTPEVESVTTLASLTTVATPPEKHDETPGLVAVEGLANDEDTRLFDAEMLVGYESTLAENVEVQKIVDTDQPLAEAVARIKQLSAEVFSLRGAVRAVPPPR